MNVPTVQKANEVQFPNFTRKRTYWNVGSLLLAFVLIKISKITSIIAETFPIE